MRNGYVNLSVYGQLAYFIKLSFKILTVNNVSIAVQGILQTCFVKCEWHKRKIYPCPMQEAENVLRSSILYGYELHML